jgi:rod shape determining protein RodA
MQSPTRIWRHFDVWLFMVVTLLTIIGIALIRSAIAGNETLADAPNRQAIFAAIGLGIMLLTAAIDYRFWSALTRPFYIFVLVSLFFILVAGIVGFGAARWFQVGIVNIQPSELAKILMILILADYLSRHQETLNQPSTILGSLLLVGVPFLLVFLQPDLSTAIVLVVVWFALVWAAGIRMRHLVTILGVGVLSPILIWPFLADYQRGRIITFFFPDPAAGFGDTYNVNQALISIGHGGIFGQGYGNGTQVQLRFLKVRHTDFIFSSMSEEFGFIGAIFFLILFLFIIHRCLRAARMARDLYGSLICYGVAILLLFQGAFNVGVNLNIFPVSGLPLPFLSSGGSSLVTSLLGIGLVESVNLRHKRLEL